MTNQIERTGFRQYSHLSFSVRCLNRHKLALTFITRALDYTTVVFTGTINHIKAVIIPVG